MPQRPAPIVILGAPRSGTSMLQKILRECPGCGSVPREAQHIWHPHVHPRNSDWRGELAPPALLHDRALLAALRRQFDREAVPAAAWRSVSGNRLLRVRSLEKLVRLLPGAAVKTLIAWKSSRRPTTTPLRLIEKTVHGGLWMDLILAVFPDARIIHLIRHPRHSVASMRAGWNAPGRFVSFELPLPLRIPDYRDDPRHWCFPLPVGWRDEIANSLLSVCAFQWQTINQSILDFAAAHPDVPYCRVRLEDLVAEPARQIPDVFRFCDIDAPAYVEQFVGGVPKINAGGSRAERDALDDADEALIEARTASLAARLGY